MKTTFIITSAINTQVGVYDLQTRLLQTHATIDSIYTVFKDANIILVDGGEPGKIQHPLWEQLRQRVHAYLDLTDNEQLQFLQQNFMKPERRHEMGGMVGLAKSLCELTIVNETLQVLKSTPEMAHFKDVERVFKISGRYQLSPLWRAEDYSRTTDKYVFKKSVPSWIPDALNQVGVDRFYSSRFWSFHINQLDQVIEKYQDMIVDIHTVAEANKYLDVEHLLYKHLGPTNSKELDYTHCMGTIAPNGTMIYD
jgi:hypothetical protein